MCLPGSGSASASSLDHRIKLPCLKRLDRQILFYACLYTVYSMQCKKCTLYRTCLRGAPTGEVCRICWMSLLQQPCSNYRSQGLCSSSLYIQASCINGRALPPSLAQPASSRGCWRETPRLKFQRSCLSSMEATLPGVTSQSDKESLVARTEYLGLLILQMPGVILCRRGTCQALEARFQQYT